MLKDRRENDTSKGIRVAVLILLITFFYLFCVTFLEMTADGSEQAKTIVPFLLGSVIGTLIGYYYGNKHELRKSPLITQVDEAAMEAAKTRAVAEVAMAKTKEVKNAKV